MVLKENHLQELPRQRQINYEAKNPGKNHGFLVSFLSAKSGICVHPLLSEGLAKEECNPW
jgi:hypothetical protein